MDFTHVHIRYFIGYVYHICLRDTIQSTQSLCLLCQAMLLPMPLRPLLLTLRSGFTGCIPELNEEQRLHCACPPAGNVFVESYFGVLTGTLSVSGPGVHPLNGAMVAAARNNDAFDVPMLEADAEAIFAEALRLEADTRTRQGLGAHTDKKRRVDQMVAAAQERCTKRKVDDRRTQKAQKEAEQVAERMGGRGAPASRQSTCPRKPNPNIFGPEFQ